MDGSEDRLEERQTLRLTGVEEIANAARSRRSFMIKFGRKAAWVAPVIVTLSARPAMAAASDPSGNPSAGAECVEAGDLCSVDSDCCSNDCRFGVCQ